MYVLNDRVVSCKEGYYIGVPGTVTGIFDNNKNDIAYMVRLDIGATVIFSDDDIKPLKE